MSLKNICNSIVVLLIFVSFIGAETFNWEKVLSTAEKKNPSLLKAKQLLEEAELDYKSSFSSFLPQINVSVDTARSGSENVPETQRYSTGLSGRLTLFSGFNNLAQIKIKEISLQIAREQYRKTKINTLYELKKNFVNLLWAKEYYNLVQKILSRRKDNYELLKLRYESGKEDKGSLLKVEADMLSAEYEVKKSERLVNLYKRELLSTMGVKENTDIEIEGDLIISQPLKISFEKKVGEIPEYKIAQLNLLKTEQEIILSKSNFYPSISASGNISKSGTQFSPENLSWSTGLSLSVALFSGGKNYYSYLIAKKSFEIKKQELEETYLELVSRFESLYSNYIDLSENLTVQQKYLTASEEQSKITTLKYLNGFVSYYEWYLVENEYINSEKSFLTLKKNFILSELELKKFLCFEE